MKKHISILLLISMLLSAASCSASEKPVETADTQPAETVESTEISTTETRTMHTVPEADFGGASFHSSYLDWQGYMYYFFADESTGDIMNDAIFDRTVKVEEYLNIDISQSSGYATANDQVNEIKTMVKAGDDVYQQVLLHCITGVSDLVTGGYLFNLDVMPQVNLDADWWNREQMDKLRLGKNTYYGISDYMIPCPYAIYFNKDMVVENGFENPYDLVFDGTWTLDKFVSMAVSVVRDLDGNGEYTIEDIAGVSSDANDSSKYISFMTAADQFITARDENNRIELSMNTEKTVSIIEKVYTISATPGVICRDKNNVKTLADGKLMFYLGTLAYVQETRDFDIDLGILPYPKYDENQQEYISLDWGGLMCIPGSIKNPEMVGSALELLAWESGNNVIPTYYDITLEGKLARDEESAAVLDIIFDTIVYEIGGNYFGFSTGFYQLFCTMGHLVINNQSSDFASWYKQYEKPAVKSVQTFYEQLDAVEQ